MNIQYCACAAVLTHSGHCESGPDPVLVFRMEPSLKKQLVRMHSINAARHGKQLQLQLATLSRSPTPPLPLFPSYLLSTPLLRWWASWYKGGVQTRISPTLEFWVCPKLMPYLVWERPDSG